MRISPQQIRKACRAFTLTEVMFAIAFAGLALGAIFAGTSFAYSLIKQSREDLRATQIMTEKLEELRLYTFSQLNDSTFTPRNFTEYFDPQSTSNPGATYDGTILITTVPSSMNVSYAGDMAWVQITVKWTNAAVVRTRTMDSYFSRYGLQRYIYFN